jgi:predicted RNA polymerase sigma factor
LTAGPEASAEHLLRELAPRVLGALVRRGSDFAAAEDAVQEALLAASSSGRSPERPRTPAGGSSRWRAAVLPTRRAATRRVAGARARCSPRPRRSARRAGRARAASEDDDTLELLFRCCHPALTPPSAIALTLRAVGGLTTAEIASAFLVPEATMAQRISRAKQTLQSSGASFARRPASSARSACATCSTCST